MPIQCNVISNNRGFPDDNAMTMINEQTFSNDRTGMNLDTGFSCRSLRDPSGSEVMPFFVEFMRLSIFPDRLKTRIQQNFPVGFDGRISFSYNGCLFFKIFPKFHDFTSYINKNLSSVPSRDMLHSTKTEHSLS